MKSIFHDTVKIVLETGTKNRVESYLWLEISAGHDAGFGVLVVDCTANACVGDRRANPDPPEPEKGYLERVKNEAAAVRRAVAIADEWVAFHKGWASGKEFTARKVQE